MKKKSLIETNPYLKNPTKRKMLITRSVRTSCGVEGIKLKGNHIILPKITHRKDKKIYKILKQNEPRPENDQEEN